MVESISGHFEGNFGEILYSTTKLPQTKQKILFISYFCKWYNTLAYSHTMPLYYTMVLYAVYHATDGGCTYGTYLITCISACMYAWIV